MKNGNVPEHLMRAADIIENRGWTQHMTYSLDSGAVDLSGAIALSFGVPEGQLTENMDEMAPYAPSMKHGFLLAAWEFIEGYIRQYPNDWNDDASRTQVEVVRMLKNAAAELDVTI